MKEYEIITIINGVQCPINFTGELINNDEHFLYFKMEDEKKFKAVRIENVVIMNWE